MVHSFIARKDLDSEMTVVRNEFESGENDPENVTLQRMQSVAFDWHNYGKDTIGAKSDIEHVDSPRLQAFYRQYYQPDNAVLLVAGRIDEAKTLALVNQLFGLSCGPTNPSQRMSSRSRPVAPRRVPFPSPETAEKPRFHKASIRQRFAGFEGIPGRSSPELPGCRS